VTVTIPNEHYAKFALANVRKRSSIYVEDDKTNAASEIADSDCFLSHCSSGFSVIGPADHHAAKPVPVTPAPTCS
jgi:hypothetical protein